MGQIQRYFTTLATEVEQNQPAAQGRIGYIQNKFLFSLADINHLHGLFRKMDTKGTGYISQDNFFEFLDEEMDSVVSPYVEYLFQLIEKEVEQKVSFSEWLPAISLFCLYSPDSVVLFVFQLLDSDHDHFISKKDLMTFLVQKRNNKKIFYFNYMKAVELLDIERPDKISIEQFRKIQTQIPFVCYPAFRLQKSLRNKIFGPKYWDVLYERILNKENDENKFKQQQKIQEEIRRKQQSKIDKKVEKFLQNTHLQHQPQPSLKYKNVRSHKRINSDTMVPSTVDKIEDFVQNVYQSFSKQLFMNQRKLKELRLLRCKSRSLQYIKMPLKEVTFIPPPTKSNQFLRVSQQQISISKPRTSRKSIFAGAGRKPFPEMVYQSMSKSMLSSKQDEESDNESNQVQQQ